MTSLPPEEIGPKNVHMPQWTIKGRLQTNVTVTYQHNDCTLGGVFWYSPFIRPVHEFGWVVIHVQNTDFYLAGTLKYTVSDS